MYGLSSDGISKLCFQELSLNPAALEVYVGEIPVDLTKKEFELLPYLSRMDKKEYEKTQINLSDLLG